MQNLLDKLNLKTVLIVLGVILALGGMFGFDVVQGWIESIYQEQTVKPSE